VVAVVQACAGEACFVQTPRRSGAVAAVAVIAVEIVIAEVACPQRGKAKTGIMGASAIAAVIAYAVERGTVGIVGDTAMSWTEAKTIRRSLLKYRD